jgi:hypothetical protein
MHIQVDLVEKKSEHRLEVEQPLRRSAIQFVGFAGLLPLGHHCTVVLGVVPCVSWNLPTWPPSTRYRSIADIRSCSSQICIEADISTCESLFLQTKSQFSDDITYDLCRMAKFRVTHGSPLPHLRYLLSFYFMFLSLSLSFSIGKCIRGIWEPMRRCCLISKKLVRSLLVAWTTASACKAVKSAKLLFLSFLP